MTDTLPADYSATLVSTAPAVREALAGVTAWLAEMQLSAEEVGTVELVLAEALNNIVEHAYAGCEGRIALWIGQGPRGLEFRVSDDGAGMPHDAPPLGRTADPTVPLDDQPEGGFGWFLIRQIARDIRYRRRGARNELRFRVAVGLARVG